MARIFIGRLKEGWITRARGAGSLVGAPNAQLAADSSTLTEANIPVTQAVDCSGYDSIFVGCEIAGGTNPTMTIEALFRDSEATDGGSPATGMRWRRLLAGAREGVTVATAVSALETVTVGTGTGAATFAEIRTYGHKYVFLRITTVGGTVSTTTGWTILVKPGRVRPIFSGGRR